ncbi:phosphate acyltransferase PlsX [Thomasclavelia sp.]|uniref:phosphate acyltransferase PlsX n=1 Tax=Thomasclavelia sp. TaxID=3025757 RepID=UPI0025FF4050|nr:phosphate acyltransferase PlsX [Thomasclavelia sp.]
MKLGIDAMSGDLGSEIVVKACKSFLEKNHKDELYVVGKIEELEDLKDYPQVKLIDAREILEMTENIMAIRRKKESSMVKTMMLARKGEVDAVLSCGNTGAYYACAMLFLKRIEGVEKSCLMAMMPTYNDKGVVMLDVGANSENNASQLASFAVMGSVYAKNIRKIANPKVALLNIGSEHHKGDEVHQETYKLLEKMQEINFVGNIEGKEILDGNVDVVVSDGFTGNVTLKTIEGVAKTLVKSLKDSLMASSRAKVGAILAKPALKQLMVKFDTKAAGGALMMGFVKPVIKAHGASDEIAFENAINLAFEMVAYDVVEKMKEGLK